MQVYEDVLLTIAYPGSSATLTPPPAFSSSEGELSEIAVMAALRDSQTSLQKEQGNRREWTQRDPYPRAKAVFQRAGNRPGSLPRRKEQLPVLIFILIRM